MNISGIAKLAVPAIRLLVAALVLLVVAACSSGEDRLVLHTGKGDFAFTVEIADTNEERAKGLMFRNELAADAGMLFDYGKEQETSFWMQNTLIPLDMIFIGADGVVKNIHVNAKPLDTTPIPSGVPVRFVLEIPGGRSREIGLAVGDRVEHPRVGKSS
jgi:uncharacterized membrane protein (UPF0127 family)